MLKVSGLIKRYDKVTAVDNLTFSVNPGAIFGLLGPNGAGKTTTLRIILSIVKATSGEIFFKDKPVNSAFLNITGYLPEERGLYGRSKVKNVLRYFSGLKGIPRKTADSKIMEWLSLLEIEDVFDRNIMELSKGNQQKIQFIASVLHNPEIIILDEPFSGFDPINQNKIKVIIKKFEEERKTVIISTHLLNFAENLCSDILLINKGKAILSGRLTDIKNAHFSNIFKIDFDGVFSCAKEITIISQARNSAVIRIPDNAATPEVLRELSSKNNITQFSKMESSLNDIFIETVNSAGKNE